MYLRNIVIETTSKNKLYKILFITGIALIILGIIDFMEGSVVICTGSALTALSSYKNNDQHKKLFLGLFIAIFTGVFFLFFFSSLGGFGGKSTLSWWWGILILPYPFGWLIAILLLIIRYIRKPGF